MKRHLLIGEWLSTPWALQPERMAALAAVLARWDAGESPSADTMAGIAADIEARDARKAAAAQVAGGIAVLPLYGVVTQRGNLVDQASGPGSASTQQFSRALREAIADPAVGQVLIDIDSPGGSVYGVAELAAEIYDARAKKPVVAIANSLAASAAYWIGASADKLYCTPGGEVGSIGVWMAHEDWSKAREAVGVNTTLVSAGKFKTEGNSYGPLSDEARAFMQSRVNDYYGAFVKAVAKGRGVPVATVRDGMGQGRVLGADQALAEGMVDGVETFDGVLKTMQRNARDAARNRQASAERDRLLQVLG